MSETKDYSLTKFSDGCPRGAVAIYCDSIREELSGKTTFVGVYGSALLVPSFPAVLPELNIKITAWTSYANPFRKIVVRLLKDDQIIAEAPMPPKDLEAILESAVGNTKVTSESRMYVHSVIRISPLSLESKGVLRARVETEEGELRAGALAIGLAAEAS